MKVRLFTIPNILTLSNLFCGSMALIEILLNQDFTAAFILIILSAFFDFCDGLAARTLSQYSPIGVELDSLADMVSFGLVPAVAMFSLFNLSPKSLESELWIEWGAYITIIIACFSALRLAKFNIDQDQKSSFIGLPTPANAIFCLSLAWLMQGEKISMCGEAVVLISVVMAVMLIVPMRMLALKFSSLSWRENRVRFIFLIASAGCVVALREFAPPVIIALYIVISAIDGLLSRRATKC